MEVETRHQAKYAFNKAVDDKLDDNNYKLDNDEGHFTLDDKYDLPQWDSAYGDTNNLALDTRVYNYKVELENGEKEKILANQIAAILYSQLDDEGREVLAFRAIIDHKADGTA